MLGRAPPLQGIIKACVAGCNSSAEAVIQQHGVSNAVCQAMAAGSQGVHVKPFAQNTFLNKLRCFSMGTSSSRSTAKGSAKLRDVTVGLPSRASQIVQHAAWDASVVVQCARRSQQVYQSISLKHAVTDISASSRASSGIVRRGHATATYLKSFGQRSSASAPHGSATDHLWRIQRRAYNNSSYAQVRFPQSLLAQVGDPMNVIKILIGMNVAVWGAWQVSPYSMSRHFVTSPQALREGRWHTLLTSAFSQSEVWHLAANMFTLYFFGQEVVLLFGPTLFLKMYCGAGIVAAAAQVGWAWYKALHGPGGIKLPASFREMQLRHAPGALGASGAVSAVMAAGVLMAPMRIVYVFMPIPIPMPAAILGLGYMYIGVSGALKDDSSVGHLAHLTGAAAGVAIFIARRRGFIRSRW